MEDLPIFRTERLVARRLTADDAPAMVAIFGYEEAMRYVGNGRALTEENCRYWVVDVTDKNFEVRGYGLVGFVDPASDDLIACAGVFHPGQQIEPEVMYWVRRGDWGKGYATEIVSALVAHGRAVWGIQRMMATIHPDNLASQRVIAKCGFARAQDRVNDDGSVTQVWESG